MELLDNAIESIQVGVEDYRSGSRPRLLSAVRNIHAGILLLYKEALRRMSPAGSDDALMKARIVPSKDSSDKVVFIGEGKKTADIQQVKERFETLGIKTDWKRFDRINETRNEVEHFYPRLDQKGLEGLISDSFILVRDFIATELHDDPLDLLGEETWQAMLEVAEVYQKEKEESRKLMAEANWRFSAIREGVLDLTCPSCGSDLLKPVEDSYHEIALQCISCGEEQSPESYVPQALASALSGEAYIAMTDGGDPPVVRCPECGEKAFLTEEWRCALCEAEPEQKCALCSNPIPVEELDSYLPKLLKWCERLLSDDSFGNFRTVESVRRLVPCVYVELITSGVDSTPDRKRRQPFVRVTDLLHEMGENANSDQADFLREAMRRFQRDYEGVYRQLKTKISALHRSATTSPDGWQRLFADERERRSRPKS